MVYDGGGGGSALDRWGGEGERGERLHSHNLTERVMCPWAISKYFSDLVSNTSA
jgi:hypothetical protein